VQAEQALFPAELQLAQVTGAQFAAIADLYRALGGGWRRAMDGPASAAAP
jgi:multidrug efflux system outer membrane protein